MARAGISRRSFIVANKFGNVKTVVDGFEFDSKMEAAFYLHLKERAERGEIMSIAIHPSFVLQEGFRKHGKWYRPITYVADFGVEFADGRRVVYDVKGKETQTFQIKKKIYASLYAEPLVMVAFKKGVWVEWK